MKNLRYIRETSKHLQFLRRAIVLSLLAIIILAGVLCFLDSTSQKIEMQYFERVNINAKQLQLFYKISNVSRVIVNNVSKEGGSEFAIKKRQKVLKKYLIEFKDNVNLLNEYHLTNALFLSKYLYEEQVNDFENDKLDEAIVTAPKIANSTYELLVKKKRSLFDISLLFSENGILRRDYREAVQKEYIWTTEYIQRLGEIKLYLAIFLFGFLAIIVTALLNAVMKTLKNDHILILKGQEKLSEKNAVLKQSLDDLAKTQEKLVEAEKQASLAKLVGGMAHELNTPLSVVLSYTGYQQKELDKLIADYENGIFKKSNFEKFCLNMRESFADNEVSLKRLGSLIQMFKKSNIETSSFNKSILSISKMIEVSQANFSHDITKKKINVSSVIDSSLLVNSYDEIFTEIFDNLLENSINHGFENKDNGIIEISCSVANEFLILEYKDNGCGMSEETERKVFDPFYTEQMGKEGVGLGMNYVFNLVTNYLNGSILCGSTLDISTRFTITIPITNNSACELYEKNN